MGPIDRGRWGGSLKSGGKSHRDLEEEGSLERGKPKEARERGSSRGFPGLSTQPYLVTYFCAPI